MHVVIVGTGPAGVSAALYARRGGADVTVVAKDGGALSAADRIENYYGFEEPISGAELLHRGSEGARRLGVVFERDEVVGFSMPPEGNGYIVVGRQRSYAADALVLAAGAQRAGLPVAGIRAFEGHGVSSCAVCDAFFYRGRHVAVIGAGAYAQHEAQILLPHAARVTLLTNGTAPEVSFPPAVTVDTRRLLRVEGERRVERVVFADETSLDVDGVFLAVGVAGSTALAQKLGVRLDGSSIAVDAHMATNVPHVYAAGDCTGGLLQIAKAVYEGAQAGLSAVKTA